MGKWKKTPLFKELPQEIIDEADKVVAETPPWVKEKMDGRKFDEGKADWTLMPWFELEEVQAVLDHGAKKYGKHNWKSVEQPRTRYLAAMLRHVTKYAMGERNDPESGLHHLAHAVCCALFIIHFDI